MSDTEGLTLEDELEELEEDQDETGEGDEEPEAPKPERRMWKGSCPKSSGPHEVVPNPRKRGPYDDDYVCTHCGKSKWTPSEIEELITNPLLREDSNREMCKQCLEEDPNGLPYGQETGHVEHQIQFDDDNQPILDAAGNPLVVAFPELMCERGHRWYKGEGPRRDLRGRNPILFETHLYNRRRRELLAKEGVVDPAYTMDRWGKRPTQGLYVRSHPQGRKTNTPEQRKEHGAGFYK